MRIYLGLGEEKGINFDVTHWLMIPKSTLNPDPLMVSKVEGAIIVTCKQEKCVFKKGVTLTCKSEKCVYRESVTLDSKREQRQWFIDINENDLLEPLS